MYLNTEYFLQMYLNAKYIDVFKYFFKYFQNIDLFNPLTFFKWIIVSYILDYLIQLSRMSKI